MSTIGFPPSVLQETLQRASYRMDISTRTMGYEWTDNIGWSNSTSIGTAPVDASLRGGVLSATTTAAGASTSGRQSGIVGYEGTANELFYHRARWKYTTTPYATALAGTGMDASGVWTGTDHVLVGIRGATSTTKYVGRIGANTSQSTVTIDTGWHTAEIWSDGTTGYVSIDDETPVSIALSTPGAALYLQYACSNGGTATVQTLSVDWAFWAWAHTTT